MNKHKHDDTSSSESVDADSVLSTLLIKNIRPQVSCYNDDPGR